MYLFTLPITVDLRSCQCYNAQRHRVIGLYGEATERIPLNPPLEKGEMMYVFQNGRVQPPQAFLRQKSLSKKTLWIPCCLAEIDDPNNGALA